MKKTLCIIIFLISGCLLWIHPSVAHYSRDSALCSPSDDAEVYTTDTGRTFICDDDYWDDTIDHLNELAETAENMDEHIMRDTDGNLFIKDEDFIYIAADHECGMHFDYFVCMRSTDGGKNYLVENRNLTEDWQLEAFQHYVIAVEDNYDTRYCPGQLYNTPCISISSDYGATFSQVDFADIQASYAVLQFTTIGIRVQYEDYDAEAGTIRAIIKAQNSDRVRIPIAEMTINLDTLEIYNPDIYMEYLNTYYKDYQETGYWLKDSLEKCLDENTLTSIYNQMELCKGSEETADNIRLAINEIYARLGYDFSGTDYEDAFSSRGWYDPVPGKTVSEEELTDIEKYNINLLVRLENEYRMKE